MNCRIDKYVQQRIKSLQLYMQQEQIDTVLLSSPENVFYFSNFNPILTSHPALLLIDRIQPPCLLVHAIRCDHAKAEGAIADIQLYGKWGANAPLALQPLQAVRELLGDRPLVIGLEFTHLPMSMQRELHEVLHIEAEHDVSAQINDMKNIKDDYEISCIRKAAHLTDIGVQTTISYLEAGYNEAQACTEGQYQMRKTWHELYQDYEVSGFSSPETGLIDSCVVWSMANERIAYGCDCPKPYMPQVSDLVLPMSWAKIGGYSAENERTVFVGRLDGVRAKAYSAVLNAGEQVYKLLRPGTTFEELYLCAAKIFEQHGFGNILPGRIGHGIGLSAHEHLSLAQDNRLLLKQGMTFTVEPGLMTKDWGGVRHSDTILITDDGFEFLTKLERGELRIK